MTARASMKGAMVVCPFLLEIIFHSISSAVRGRVSLAIASAAVIPSPPSLPSGGALAPQALRLSYTGGGEGMSV